MATENPTWKLRIRDVKSELQTSQGSNDPAGYSSANPVSFGIDLSSIHSAEDGAEQLKAHAGKLKQHWVSLRANSFVPEDIFKSITKTLIEEHQKISDEFHEVSNKLKNDRVDRQTAQTRMQAGRQNVKLQSESSIDKTFDDAEMKIDSLPEPQQDAAVDIWLGIFEGFLGFWQNVLNQFLDMLNAIFMWPANVWEIVDKAWNTVNALFVEIWNWFNRLF